MNTELLAAWERTANEAKELKALEMKLRNEVLKEFFDFDYDDRKGTTNYPLPNNHKLKAVFKLNYKLENKDGETLTMMGELERAGLVPELVNRLVKWKPELSVSEYNKLSPEHKEIVDNVLVTTPATPSIEIVAPKERKR